MQAVSSKKIAARKVPEALKITYTDLQGLPQDMNNTRYELFEGVCVMTPSPSYRHQNAVANLFYHMSRYIRERKLGKLLTAPCDVYFDETTVFEPDLLFISTEQMGIIGERRINGAPDLVIEVLSPTTEDRDRGYKQKRYAMEGVREYWLVDPEADVVEVLGGGPGEFEVLGRFTEQQRIRSGLFDGLEIRVDELWE